MCNLLQKQLEAKVKELETTTKNLADLKVHYDMFTQLKNKEIEALTNSCEQRKKVIEEFEEKVTSLRNKLELLQISKEQEIGALRKQIDGISAVNDVLRKTLNEKIEELKQVCDKVSFICLWNILLIVVYSYYNIIQFSLMLIAPIVPVQSKFLSTSGWIFGVWSVFRLMSIKLMVYFSVFTLSHLSSLETSFFISLVHHETSIL